jgi:hypothetical protein
MQASGEGPIGAAAGAPATVRCGNCGAPLLGPHCYACGQPVKGLVRHFTSIVGDFFDSVFDLDARTWRSLGPLMFRPGHLSCEYFEGRRVRYVSPVRLFFFLCVAAFFALQLVVNIDEGGIVQVESGTDSSLRADAGTGARPTSAQVQADRAPADPSSTPSADRGTDAAPTDAPPAGESFSFEVAGQRWHPVDNPVSVEGVPDFANRAVNQALARVEANARRIRDEPGLLVRPFLENLPAALFVLLPVFAALLKVFFLFKRRLYMEHLIVALHSHAFLCASLLVVAGLIALRDVLGTGLWFEVAGVVEGLLLAWMPLYLLLMQRRVYRQNWVLTVLKFGVLGISYTVLLSLVSMGALAISLVTL